MRFNEFKLNITQEGAEDYAGTYSPEAIALGKRFCEHYGITDDTDVQLAVEIIDSYLEEFKRNNKPIDLKIIKSGVADAFRQVYRGMGPGPSFRKGFKEQLNPEDDDDYEDEDPETELRSGDYVRDTMDGESGEIFRMQGDPYERRVRILDRDGRGWYIEPSRLIRVDANDPDVQHYFGKQRQRDMDEALSKKDLLGRLQKDLPKVTDPKNKDAEPVNWTGPGKDDYGYTGYQGHGMPTDRQERARIRADKKKDVTEGLKPGEYHIHTVYFKDGTKKRIRVTSDEFDVAGYYTKRGQAVDRVDYDYQIHSDMTEGAR